MATTRGSSMAGPGGLSPPSLAIEKLQSISTSDASTDGILFSGIKHDIVPRALFLDRRLTPLERNAWQVIRMMLNDDGVTAFPTYEHLRPFLASVPCAEQASDETVARALMLLRLARWLTLARHRRDLTTGRIQCNLYVLHDEPLTPYEAIQLDPHYLELVSHSLTHASKAIQRVGYFALKEATDDPLVSGRVLPTRLQALIQQLSRRGWTQPPNLPEEHTGAATDSPTSDSQGGAGEGASISLRNPKIDSTVRTDPILKDEIRTVLQATQADSGSTHTQPVVARSIHLKIPDAFRHLREEQQAGALAALQRVDLDLQQAVLDEWAVRCRSSKIRNPAGYLFGVIQKAIRGEFKAWASERARNTSTHSPSASVTSHRSESSAVSRQQAQQHIAKLRAMLNIE